MAVMKAVISRRRLAAAFITPATSLLPAQESPAPLPPEKELEAARDRIRQNVASLKTYPLPVSTEPAFQFKP
jgi:hypothetical protein